MNEDQPTLPFATLVLAIVIAGITAILFGIGLALADQPPLSTCTQTTQSGEHYTSECGTPPSEHSPTDTASPS